MARFRVAKGQLLVIDPSNKSETKVVTLIADRENATIGVKIEEGDLKGYTIFVKEAAFVLTKQKGMETDSLKR